MISIDCSELSADEKLALASEISDQLEGRALALSKADSIVLDQLDGQKVSVAEVSEVVKDFISRREEGEFYSFEVEGERILVHSADPVAAQRPNKKTMKTLPPNVMQCPYCAFITLYQEEYTVHVRSHLFGV